MTRERPHGVTYGFSFSEQADEWYGGDFATRSAACEAARAACDSPGETVYTCEAKHLAPEDVALELDAQDLLERLEERLADSAFGFHEDAFIRGWTGSSVAALEETLRAALVNWLTTHAHLAPIWQAVNIETHLPEAPA